MSRPAKPWPFQLGLPGHPNVGSYMWQSWRFNFCIYPWNSGALWSKICSFCGSLAPRKPGPETKPWQIQGGSGVLGVWGMLCREKHYGAFLPWLYPQLDGLVMENPLRREDVGIHPILGNLHISSYGSTQKTTQKKGGWTSINPQLFWCELQGYYRFCLIPVEFGVPTWLEHIHWFYVNSISHHRYFSEGCPLAKSYPLNW